MRPLVPEDVAERERRREYIRQTRAELARGRNSETREARFARRETEYYRLIERQLMQLAPGDLDISASLLLANATTRRIVPVPTG
jgi:hypothetical protein